MNKNDDKNIKIDGLIHSRFVDNDCVTVTGNLAEIYLTYVTLQDILLFHHLKDESCHTKIYEVPIEHLWMLDHKLVCPYVTHTSVYIKYHIYPNTRQKISLLHCQENSMSYMSGTSR
jgi:hypothetical protein